MNPGAGPPRLVERWLERALEEGGLGAAIVGDLREEYAGLPRRWSGWRAQLWYAVQASRVVVRVRATRGMSNARDRGAGMTMGDVGQDLRYGIRSLLGARAFTTFAVLTVAVGIGATTAIYSVVHGILRDPLPFGEPHELVDLSVNTGGGGWYGASVPEYMDFQRDLSTVSRLGGYTTGTRVVGDTLQPRRVPVAFVTHDFFPTLAAAPIVGRYFTPEEDMPSAAVSVILSEGFWRQDHGADLEIVGKSIQVGGASAQVIGVMPQQFRFPAAETAMWFAFRLNRDDPAPRANHFVRMVARLGQGASVEQARSEVNAVAGRSIEQYPENYSERGFRTRVIPLREAIVGGVERAIFVAFGAVLLVLLVACVNVSNLLLSRADGRRREMAVRSAIGAGRGRLIGQLAVENGLIAAVGGVLGLGLGWLGMRSIIALAPPGTPRLDNVRMSPEIVLFVVLVGGLCGLAFGLWPAAHGAGRDLKSALGEGGRGGAGRKSQRIRQTLVASQVALAATLAVGAAVMVRSIDNLYSTDRGFSGENVLTFRVDLPSSGYADDESRRSFVSRTLGEITVQEGVVNAAVAARLPLYNTYAQWSLALEGAPVGDIGTAPDGYGQVSTPAYFGAMGIRAVRGRLYDDSDLPESPPVTVINETMAATLWPGQEPLGQRFRMWSEGWPFIEVVGVIADVKELRIDEPAQPRFYVPYTQASTSAYQTPSGMFFVIELQKAPLDFLPTARRIIADIDPTLPVSNIAPMMDIVAESLATQRFASALLKVFGAIAVLLACVGVYGVLSISVGQKVPEIGLRKALGAADGKVLGSVLRASLRLTVMGGAVGLFLGVVLSTFMEGLLFGVRGSDPATLASVAAVIGGSALLAAWIPARRASRIDPMVALKR